MNAKKDKTIIVNNKEIKEIKINAPFDDIDEFIKELNSHVDLIEWFRFDLKVRSEMITKSKEEKKFQTYIMLNKRNGYYKIGKAIKPKLREKTLQSEEPDLKLIFIIPLDVEKELHNTYMSKKVRGEWFKLSNFDVLKIKEKYLNDK